MKKLKRLVKTFAVHAMIFSLLQTSFVLAATTTANVAGQREILGLAMTAVNTYGQFLGQKQNMIMQQIQAQKNAQLMQTMSPSCRKPDGTSCYTVAGKYFPECPLPASMSSFPQNVCSESVADPNQSAMQLSSMITYEAVAKGWVNYYEQMQNTASNAQRPFGLKCLEDKKKALDSQLTEMVNNLTRLQDQLAKDKETFRNNNKKLMEEMATTNDELLGFNGGTGKNNLKLKTQDFSKYFSQSCQSVIGEEAMAQAPAVGLIGVMQQLSPMNKRAADFGQNEKLIESEIQTDIAKIQQAIASGGLQD